MQEFLKVSHAKLRQYNVVGLVAVVHALAELEHVPDKGWLEQYTLMAEGLSADMGSSAHGTVSYCLQRLQELHEERGGGGADDGFTFTLSF